MSLGDDYWRVTSVCIQTDYHGPKTGGEPRKGHDGRSTRFEEGRSLSLDDRGGSLLLIHRLRRELKSEEHVRRNS